MEFGPGIIQSWIERHEFKCPGCGLDDEWAFDRAGEVVTLPAQTLGQVPITSPQAARFAGHDVEKAMENVIEALLSASRQTANQVVKLPCGNCGYVLFLDASKLPR
jgi:predicted RNA-binding Zn-ribbon protein involved in translation (DUF1610 family)